MHDPPFSVLATEYRGHAQCVRRGFSGSYLAVVPLDLDDLCKLSRCVFGNAFEGERLAIVQLRGGSVQRFRDLLPAARRRLIVVMIYLSIALALVAVRSAFPRGARRRIDRAVKIRKISRAPWQRLHGNGQPGHATHNRRAGSSVSQRW